MSYIVRREIENYFCEGVIGKPILTKRQLLEVDSLISDWKMRYEFWKAGIKMRPYIISSKYYGRNLEEVLKYIGFNVGLPYLRIDIDMIDEFEEDLNSLLISLFTDQGSEIIPIWRTKYLVHIISRYDLFSLADGIKKIAESNPENLVILSGEFENYPYERLNLKVEKGEKEELKKVIIDNLRKAGLTSLESLDEDLEGLIEKLDQIKFKLIKNELLRTHKA